MSQPEAPNPERRSNGAILCLCIGIGLGVLSWFLGLGAVIAAAASGGDPAALVGGFFAMIALALLGVSAGILSLIGVIWMIAQVISDQTGDKEEKRYRNVER
ncbi:MAG: hypothetical protein AB7J28_04720 [Hyphomonadaceae bacterium]